MYFTPVIGFYYIAWLILRKKNYPRGPNLNHINPFNLCLEIIYQVRDWKLKVDGMRQVPSCWPEGREGLVVRNAGSV